MSLLSPLFAGDARLQQCATSDPAHITPNSSGSHVSRIQLALIQLDGSQIDPSDITRGYYGASTANAVLSYKTSRKIVNARYETKPDNVIGKMTIISMDNELIANAPVPTPPPAPTHLVKFTPVPDNSFRRAGFGAFLAADNLMGFDALSDSSPPNMSWQMVPMGGSRDLLAYDSGIEKGTPNLGIALEPAVGTVVSNIALIATATEKANQGTSRRMSLTGIGPGGVNLVARSREDNTVAATLQIAVLLPKPVTFGFAILKDNRGMFRPAGSIE